MILRAITGHLQQLSRRRLLRQATYAVAASLLNLRGLASAAATFEPTTTRFPQLTTLGPTVPVQPPDGCTGVVFDIFGNYWCLAPADSDGNWMLLVLPAQSNSAWLRDQISSLPSHSWKFLAADEFGYLWIASASRCMRLDPHTPEAGWMDFSSDVLKESRLPARRDSITALGVSGSGAALVALQSGVLVEVDRIAETTVFSQPAPAMVERIVCDDEGRLWLLCGDRVYWQAAERDAWQRTWELVDRLPAGDHDLSGDVMDGRFYMVGGQNAGWGYPAKPHVFRDLFEFSPDKERWSITAKLDVPRFYNGTSYLDGRVWVIGGYTRDAIGNAVPLTSVVMVSPQDGRISDGPELPNMLENPIAFHVEGRIYIAGLPKQGHAECACQLLSIGAGEQTWRRERDGPSYLMALAGVKYEQSLYLALPGKGLACFDTASRAWTLIEYTHSARSPQVATYKNEIWVMGGRDIERQQRTVIYQPRTGTWRHGPDLPRPLAWGAAVTVGGRLMVVGGAAGRGYNNRTFLLRTEPLS